MSRRRSTATRQPQHHHKNRLSPGLRAWARSMMKYGVFVELEHPIGSYHGINSHGSPDLQAWALSLEQYGVFVEQSIGGQYGKNGIAAAKIAGERAVNEMTGILSTIPTLFQLGYMRTPDDVEIYSDAPCSGSRVLSIKQLLPNPGAPRTYGYDHDWETYAIAEGAKICITRPGYQPCHITIPSRILRAGRYIVMPEYW
ncbi:hypothetical protein BD779DRAFT_1478718 [Infundibulicybe gibba]|nr:hypothetical protein BD779DRAFT_1478718 [Infundibulicybe gibba]